MDKKKLYTIIAAIFAAYYAYNLFWISKDISYVLRAGFQLRYYSRYLTVALGITGLIIFIASQFKRSNLLRIVMCMHILSYPFTLFFYYQYFSRRSGAFINGLSWPFYIGIVIGVIMLITSIVGLRLLSINKTAKLSYNNYGSGQITHFTPANGGLRFCNRLVDALVIAYIIFSNSSYLKGFGNIWRDMPKEMYFVFEIPFLILYYIILEGIFNTTAGKCATGTTIVNDAGDRPSFAQILGRTFCRLIPFEAFSFFSAGARGWHDSITNTYVTESIDKEDQQQDEFILDAELNNP